MQIFLAVEYCLVRGTFSAAHTLLWSHCRELAKLEQFKAPAECEGHMLPWGRCQSLNEIEKVLVAHTTSLVFCFISFNVWFIWNQAKIYQLLHYASNSSQGELLFWKNFIWMAQ
jgi:hypothetical protein